MEKWMDESKKKKGNEKKAGASRRRHRVRSDAQWPPRPRLRRPVATAESSTSAHGPRVTTNSNTTDQPSR